MNRLIPPTKNIEDLSGRSKTTAARLFWLNLAILSSIIGFGLPAMLNRMIKRDVDKETQSTILNKIFFAENKIFKDFQL